jgi:hypothetical protein
MSGSARPCPLAAASASPLPGPADLLAELAAALEREDPPPTVATAADANRRPPATR